MVNHYLRRHGTDSMPKKRRLRRWLLTLFVLFCSMSPWQGVQAYTDYDRNWSSISFDPTTGCIVYDLRIYQSYGGGEGNCGSCGFSKPENKNGVHVCQKTSPQKNFYFACEEACNYTCNLANGMSDLYNPTYPTRGSGNSEKGYVCFSVPISQSDLNQNIDVTINGKWWRAGTFATDQDVNDTYTVSTKVNLATYSKPTVEYSSYQGAPALKVTWKRGTSGAQSTWGDVYLYQDGKTIGTGITVKPSYYQGASSSESFYVIADNAKDLNKASSFSIHQIYKPHSNLQYVVDSDPVTALAYVQTTSFEATPEMDDKRIRLQWETPTFTGDESLCDLSPFVLTVRNESAKKVEKIEYEYKPREGKYIQYYELADGDTSTYTFSLERKSTEKLEEWSKVYKREQTVTVNTNHCYPFGYSVTKIDPSDENEDPYMKITWGKSGSLWTERTVMKVVQKNLTSVKDYVYELDEAAYRKGYLDDRLVEYCNKYQYEIILSPGGNSYDVLDTILPKTFKTEKIGTVQDLEVSKGYYSDRVVLNWKTTGGFDEIVVERKEYGNDMSEYMQLPSVSISGLNANNYTIDDNSCQAGVFYSYRVYGRVKCAGVDVFSRDTLYGYGFRTPTGNFYGRVTYQNGQSVDSVEVRLESEEKLSSYALLFKGDGVATISDGNVLKSGYPLTMQAWMKMDSMAIGQDTMTLIDKSGYFKLGLIGGSVFFSAGDSIVKVDTTLSPESYAHVTAVALDTAIRIYLNGSLVKEKVFSSKIDNSTTTGLVTFGKNYWGELDEVRLWSRALEANEISKDYSRYLVGNEKNLEAYYTFDFMPLDEFYDLSYTGTVYHGNMGMLNKVMKVESGLSTNELSYRGYTNGDGTYSVNAVPYFGNGTSYTVIPKKGSHQFSPTREVRFISADAQNHTVNFTDNSSFEVSGIVRYSGGQYPVEGVSFTVDGVTAMSKSGKSIVSGADGKFTINVPVGIHEVKAEMNGHTFELDGRICNSDSSDRNYQDNLTGVELYDNTKVKYIGRVCGGEVQEAYPVGFSLSKNNLANDMKVVLTPTSDYKLKDSNRVYTDTIAHLILSGDVADGRKVEPKYTVCDYNVNDITIHVNNETGEFVAWVYPIEYNVSLDVYGHQDIMGDNSLLDLSSFANKKEYETYSYKDSVTVYENGGYVRKYVPYNDSVDYRHKQIFTKRYRAKMDVVPLALLSDKELDYFGDKVYRVTNLAGEQTRVPLFVDSTKSYTFGLPVFIMEESYRMRYDIYEEYPFYVDSKKTIDSSRIDRVPVEDAEVEFNNKLAKSSSIDTDKRIYSFVANEPDLSTAKATIAATFTYGDSDNPTSVSWENPMGNVNGEAYVFGSHQTGADFVTAGPDKFLTVLRDPPGSNSYSYLEKGVTFTESDTYTGSFHNEGSEVWTQGVQVSTLTFAGTSGITVAGTAQVMFESESGVTLGIEHEETYTGSNSKTTTTTTTTRFQTSDDPSYVGADADLYIGYSTNLSFGTNVSITVVDRKTYDDLGSEYYEETFKLTDDYAIVKSNGYSVGTKFNTLFAYPQRHVEQVLIPNLKELRKGLLILPGEMTDVQAQEKADRDKQPVYLSKVEADDDNFGEKNSYTCMYPKGVTSIDTIAYLTQSIHNWENALKDNDSVKVMAESLHQNYSFHAGSNVEYSEAYSSALSSTHSFELTIGGLISNDWKFGAAGTKTVFAVEEHASTTQGGEFADEVEASHAKGFVLAEDGNDYLSVDVLYEEIDKFEDLYSGSVGAGTVDRDSTLSSLTEKQKRYPSFVFRTRGGATSCPYEGAYLATHWPGHEFQVINAPTMQMEVPKVDMPKKYIENVPSGEEAFLTIRMMNNSETGDDQTFNLRLVDSSNPNGAVVRIDGNSMSGMALVYNVPAGQMLEKTVAVSKGSVLNYDHLKLALSSQCQEDIADTVDFNVHFIPSCTSVSIIKPTDNWTYNTNCPVDTIDGLVKHYMPITISDFDVNYTDFEHIELQYKPSSSSDNDWITLAYYYKEDSLAQKAVANGFNAFLISSEDAGNIYYKFYMDENPDQYYDLRAVSYCNINNELYDNPSEVVSGIKDMYNPRLFGSPRPANGVLTIDDDIRIDFNETIADGKLTVNNFEITGVRNGVASDHSVAIALDGENDYLATEVSRNFANKDLTFECWVNFDSLQNATFFSHGDAANSISMGMNKEGKIVVKVGGKEIVSQNVPAWEKSSWNHVALVYDNENRTATAYVNYTAAINAAAVGAYDGAGTVEVGRNVATQSGNFNGKVDQFRIWNAVRSSATIQANSTTQLSGNDLNLIAYYEMEEAKGSATEDKARGANLIMKGGTWALPEGRSAEFDGASYVSMNSSAAVITSDMDFTLEFWFNAKPGATNQTLISNGTGLASNAEDASKLLRIGFDQPNVLTFCHNGYVTPVDGNFADNNWHNFTLAVNRSSGVARIYMDGELNTYFSADKIGGVASDKLFAAARVYYALNDSTSEKVRKADQKFTGMIDEVRLWNLYRQQSQVENFYNQKSNGDEMGLLLYYPFEHYVEWQGTPEMQFTLEDKGNDAVDGDGKKIAFANASGNVSASVNIPPVKNKGAVSKLLYDWVVNNDALIINLTEQDYRIEKTIVNFTVKEVQDMNGNLILSPITWSAYIDRNQLKWMDDAVTVNKKQNEPYKFEMPIVNKGGSVINYSMKNMPSWLSASPESGAINPLEKQTIEFEIDPSLAVGTYDEVVYLTSSNNVTEPLSLNVTVEGDTPEWSVDPSKYEFSMAVFAQIKLDNQFSNDEKDMLAAFYNGECVGVANMSYDKTMDMWYAMMTVYSNSNSHDLVYRAWDASKGVMMAAVSSPVVPFKADTVYGKPTAPVVFYNGTTKYQNIPLSKGWNWVSFNLENKAGMSDLTAYLNGGRWGSNSIVKDLSGHSANYSVDSRKWSNDSLVLNNTSMFKIYSDENQVLSVSGKDINLDSMLIPVKAGSWNYIAYLPAGSMTLKAALAGYEAKEGDIIKSNEGFAMYYGNEWIGSLNSLQPNCGYMLKNTGDVQKTFKYPSSSSALRSAVSVASSAYESNMSIIASAPEKREGDVLRALVGTAENKIVEVSLSDDRALQFINVSAKSGDKVRFTMERDGVVYEANNALSFTGDAVYGTPDNPFVLNFNVGGVETLTVYPNPVVDELNVAGKLDGEGDVTLELFDVVGAILYEKQVSASDNVLDESVNVTGLVPGSYMLKVTQGDESKVFKVVKK